MAIRLSVSFDFESSNIRCKLPQLWANVFECLALYALITSIILSILWGAWCACLFYVSVCPHAYLRDHTFKIRQICLLPIWLWLDGIAMRYVGLRLGVNDSCHVCSCSTQCLGIGDERTEYSLHAQGFNTMTYTN